MSRRTHYIPVGNLVLDGVSIDPAIYCPANGYPDPTDPEVLAAICPVGGYYDPDEPIPYTPEEGVPEIVPTDGEIVLIMTNALDAAVNTQVTISNATQARYTILGNNDDVLHTTTVNNNATFYYQFPVGGIPLGSGLYGYKVVISAATTGTITAFKFNTKTGFAPTGWPVLEAHIKCPTLTSLADAFNNQRYLKKVVFYGDHNALTNLGNCVINCRNLVEFHANVSMNNLITLGSTFEETHSLEILTLPASLPALTSIVRTFRYCGLKASPPLPVSLPECMSMNLAFSYMQRLKGTLYIPDAPKCLTLTYVASYNPLVEKIVFRGSYIPNNTTSIACCHDCPSLLEIDMGNVWGKDGVTFVLQLMMNVGTPLIKKIKLPNKFLGTVNGFSIGSDTAYVTELSTADWSDCTVIGQVGAYYPSLLRFDQPTLRLSLGVLSVMFLSSRPGLTNYINIDFANSTYAVQGVVITRAQLSKEEIDRIFTALPTVTSATTINVTINPGYATCDKTIAQAKGWTVT